MAVKKSIKKPAKKSPKPKLAEIKTKVSAASVEDFINAVPDEQKRDDSFAILAMMKKATGEKPKMWGSSIIGFGNVRYESPATGRQVDWFRVGFSPRKANLTVYLMNINAHAESLKKLGKHKAGGGCLYINRLSDVEVNVLKGMIDKAAKGDVDLYSVVKKSETPTKKK